MLIVISQVYAYVNIFYDNIGQVITYITLSVFKLICVLNIL